MSSSRALKIIVLGEKGVGKTSLINRYIAGTFPVHLDPQVHDLDEEVLASNYVRKRMVIDDEEMTISIWDQHESNSTTSVQSPMPHSFFAGMHGCVLVFSTIDARSLHRLESLYESVRTYCDEESIGSMPPLVIAENKIDLIDASVVDAEAVERAVKRFRLRLYRTSAKHGHQTKELFDYIAAKSMKYMNEQKSEDGVGGRRANRTASAASWTTTLPPSMSEETIATADGASSTVGEPSKRRTGGVKPMFNKNKCPVM